MKQTRKFFRILATTALNQLTAESQHSPTPRIVDIKTPNGMVLKASGIHASSGFLADAVTASVHT